MPENGALSTFASAREDFHRARRQAVLEQIVRRLSGRPTGLMSYAEVSQKLRVSGRRARELREIPLDAIVGSVGRYTDFTRSFLPKQNIDEGRWAGVKVATTGLIGLPPIEVYQIDQVYFVLDGNHRVSVARQLGASHIEAYVTELISKVPLTPDDQPDDLIQKAEYAAFLDRTGLDRIRPDADLSTTAPGRYSLLEEEIEVHHYYMGLDLERDVSFEEAVTSWYDTVYLPVAKVIREKGILQQFPERTETDLYLWALKHRERLAEELGWPIEPTMAAADLATQSTPGSASPSGGRRAVRTVLAKEPATNGQPGRDTSLRQDDYLFAEILVPLSGEETSWDALAQAFGIARREHSILRGLYVSGTEEERYSPEYQSGAGRDAGYSAGAGEPQALTAGQAVQQEFRQRCEAAGIPGDLVIASGRVSSEVCRRTRWTDLVVLDLEYPPPPQVLSKLSSGFRTILRCSACPVLAVPRQPSTLQRLLLAYDGSPKAREALFIAAYLAARWGSRLIMITASEGDPTAEETQGYAQRYLRDRGVETTPLLVDEPAAPAILSAAQQRDCDLIIMGSYGRGPIMEVALGSAVDVLLRTSPHPMLICQ